jgi:probable DNA repair protein
VASFESDAGELRAAGAWARERLAGNPSARIGIVCPGLETAADRVSRLVREGLTPGWQFAFGRRPSAVNVSFGRRLSDYGPVSVALLALRWICQGLPGREIGILARSRCLGTGDSGDRGRLELLLREFPDRAWTAGALLAAIDDSRAARGAAGFLAVVETIRDFAAAAEEKGSPVACARRIDAFLAATGWPGEEGLDSISYQLVNRWRELLSEFARVGNALPSMRLADAISRVGSMAADAVWQPETAAGPVQVLGILEAGGLEFDHLWICGLDASQWPPTASPASLLSNALQRRCGMPDASPKAALEDAWAVMNRLLGSAGDAVLSWSRLREDSELTASPLLERLDAAAYTGPGDPGWAVCSVAGRVRVDDITDDAGPPVATDETVRGGAYTVQKQYVEPFRAFAEGRLGVRRTRAFATGLSPSQRGDIVHNALHYLLAEKPDREQLAGWTPAQRLRNIGAAVDAALLPHQRAADAVLGRLISIERRRVLRLLQDFLDTETERAPFAIADLEKSLELEMHGVRLNLRVDRLDRLADGRLVVIDYKTGSSVSFSNRAGDLTEVQLVVYAEALDAAVAGLAYINLDSRQIQRRCAGAAWGDDEQDWEETLAAWRETVREAIRALAAGDVRIDLLQETADSRPLAILSRAEELRRGD